MEHLDQQDPGVGMNLAGYSIPAEGETTVQFEPKLLDGVMVLSHPARISKATIPTQISISLHRRANPPESPTTIKLIPYYAWANREPASMQVWIPYQEA